MTTAQSIERPSVQWGLVVIAFVATATLAWQVNAVRPDKTVLLAIGLALGLTLYHASFGFTGAYRRALSDGDVSGLLAQIAMLIVATALFWPLLEGGEAFGRRTGGAVAPVGVMMAIGAFVFGIGMQWGGGCASGTLFTVGGGSTRMIIVLVAFCLGAFVGSLHLGWWLTLPRFGSLSLAGMIGWPGAVAIQTAVLAGLGFLLLRIGGRVVTPLWTAGRWSWAALWRGPWPLLGAAVAFAALNAATVATAGHPWSVTWGFTLWGAELAQMFGWSPDMSSFWTKGFQRRALDGSVFADTVSLMNMGIVCGAFAAAALAGRVKPSLRIPAPAVASAIIGGLMLGYGARLAFGCNIGAFFSGVASTSLHGWVWILCAIPGNWVGLKTKSVVFGARG